MPVVIFDPELEQRFRAERDRQVPEGIYPLASLNPDSRFHVALRVGYPSDFDREAARLSGVQSRKPDDQARKPAAYRACALAAVRGATTIRSGESAGLQRNCRRRRACA